MSKLPSDLSTVTTVAFDLAKHIFQNYRDSALNYSRRLTPCNVGFALGFCELVRHLLHDRLFEHVDLRPRFRTR